MKKNMYFFTVIICLGMAVSGFAQTKTVSGVISDASIGDPIIGASVAVVGTQRGTVSGIDGGFSLEVEPNETITISYLGYAPQKLKTGEKSFFEIRLEPSSEALDEVVVTGYTTQKKSTLTGSVSTVGNEQIKITKNENVVNMLTGKLPGLRISQKSAQPGAYDTKIDVRGYGEPLFVVDGIPRDKAYFSRMDPEEIESISLLKDAAAAVYGLRAANGVMLITTKSGTAQNGKVDITYTGGYTVQQFLSVPESVSALEWMTLKNEQNWQDFNGNYLVRKVPVYTQEHMQPYIDGKPSYDWMDAVFKDMTPQTQHNLSINGGSDKLRYFLSLGYSRQDGSYRSGSLYSDKWNLRSNIDAQITKRLKARVSLGAILSTNHQPNFDLWMVYKYTWLMRPDAPIYANDNPEFLNGDNSVLYEGNNMVARTSSDIVGYKTNKSRRLNGSLTLTYDIPGIKGLSAKASYDYGLSLPDYTTYRGGYTLYTYYPSTDEYEGSAKGIPANISRSANFNTDTDLQLGLHYNHQFGDHNVNSAVIFEEAYSVWDSFTAYRELLINSQYLYFGEDENQSATGGAPGDRLNQALIGQFNYNYSGKYLVDFRFRYDGSSRFPKGSRWGFFPSVSLGYRISEESFIKDNVDFLSNLKFRASYGEMGDDASAGNYPPTIVGYNFSGTNRGWYFDHVLSAGVTATSIPNPDLTWYKIKMYNLALDFAIYQNKLSGTLEVFRRNRSGLLATRGDEVPATVGASLPQENLNSDRNFGWEIELAHRNRIDNFSYFVSGQLSATKSMRTDWLETPAGNSYDQWRNRTSGRYNNIWWGTESGGMFTNYEDIRTFYLPMGQGSVPGDWWTVDWNEDGVIDDKDQHPIATRGLPIFNYGISMGAGYRDFDLAVNLQGSYGVYSRFSEVLAEPLSFGGQNTLYWFMDRWHPEDPNADYFHPDTKWVSGYYPVTGHDGRRTGTNAIQDASYIRLKTLELGYTLPKKVLSKLGIKNLRMYLSGYNLLTFTPLKNIDPERPGSEGGASDGSIDIYNYPNNRTYTIGASIKF
ncbi:MAG: TonB-dependent receptor [Dysgonamonadaceae bacterium]|jgi:TonB-linked SusC/RagA family outer membrane protein|nr:TonB-dependent receptor [Dysgonamonadaceae bacterium]